MLLVVVCAIAADGFTDYSDRPARCGGVGAFDVDVSSRCQKADDDATRGAVFILMGVPFLLAAGTFGALFATRDPYRLRLAGEEMTP